VITRPPLYGRLTWPEVARLAGEDRVCLVPVATLEDHGHHLPIDVDLRIVDESGEDYLYPAEWFAAVEIPRRVRTSLLRRPARLQSA